MSELMVGVAGRGQEQRTDAGLDACNRPDGSIGRIPGGMR